MTVEGTLADVRIPVEEHQGNPGKAGGAVVLVIDCAAYVQLLGLDAHSDAGMQLIRLLAQAKPGRFVDLNFWSSRTPDLEMPGWMRPSPVVSLREGLPDGHLLLGADETQLWRNLLPKAATLNTEDLEPAGAARLRHDWHRDLLTATCQRFQEFARRKSGDQRDRMAAVEIDQAIERAVPMFCDRDRDLSSIAQVMIPVHYHQPEPFAKFVASKARNDGPARSNPPFAKAKQPLSIH